MLGRVAAAVAWVLLLGLPTSTCQASGAKAQMRDEKIARLQRELAALLADRRKMAPDPRLACQVDAAVDPAVVTVLALRRRNGSWCFSVNKTRGERRTVVTLPLVGGTEIELDGVLLRVQAPPPPPPAPECDPGVEMPGVVGGNVLGLLFFCTVLIIMVLLEKQFQCVGSEKLHHMVEEHHKVQKDVKNALHFIKGEEMEPDSDDEGDTDGDEEGGTPGTNVANAKLVGHMAGHTYASHKGAKGLAFEELMVHGASLLVGEDSELVDKGKNALRTAGGKGKEALHSLQSELMVAPLPESDVHGASSRKEVKTRPKQATSPKKYQSAGTTKVLNPMR